MRRAGRGGETGKGWVSYGKVWHQLAACSVSLAPPPCQCSIGSSRDQWCPHPCWWRGAGEEMGWSVWKKLGAMHCHPELLTFLGRLARHWRDMAKQNLHGRCQPKLTSPSLSPTFLQCYCTWYSLVPSCTGGLAGWESHRGDSIYRGKRQAESTAHHGPALLSSVLPGSTSENWENDGKGAGEFAVHFWPWTQGFPLTLSVWRGCLKLLCATPESSFSTQSLGSNIESCLPFFGCFFLKWQAARLQSKALSINSILLERSSCNSICLHSLPCRDVKGVSRRWKHSAPGPLLFFVPFLGSRWYGWSKSRHYLLGIPPKGVCNVLAVVRPMNTCIRESGIYVVPKEAWALAWPVAPQTWWILRYVLKSD